MWWATVRREPREGESRLAGREGSEYAEPRFGHDRESGPRTRPVVSKAIAVSALACAPTRRTVPGSDAVADGHGGIDERKQK